jgi:hypothetical protein
MTSSSRRIPEVYRGTGDGQELSTFINHGARSVQLLPVPPPPPRTRVSPTMFFIQNNLAFSIFIMLFIAIFIYLMLFFLAYFSAAVNAYLLGVFKRPLPSDPAKYFDINCINSMSYEDFINTNQVERCRGMSPINRPGPPRRF